MRKTVIQLVAVVFALGMLVWLLNRIGWQTVGSALERVGWRGMALLAIYPILETMLDGAALWIIMGPPLKLGFAVAVNCAGSMLNLVVPWESGEILKGGLLRKHFESAEAISGTVIWNYIFRISRPAVSALTAVLTWLFWRDLPRFTIGVILAANAFAFLPYLVLRFAVRWGAARGLMKVLSKLPIVKRHPRHWVDLALDVDRRIQRFWQERPRDYLKVFGLQVLARATGLAGIYTCFRLMDLPYTLVQATGLYATMNVAEYVIAILPARVGVPEGSAYFVFKFLGLDPATGVIVYVILRVRSLAANGLLTPFAFLRMNRG